MEDQNLSRKSICSKEHSSSSEESGWTSYFEDFLASENRNTAEASITNLCVTSSLVSDASWKPQVSSQPLKDCNKLNLKKTKKKKTRMVFDDDSLEDTATSPVNIPNFREFISNFL